VANVIPDLRKICFSSDPHYDHANILNFLDDRGKRFRGDLFASVEEMNETMIQRHNSVVKPNDIWYCLGDVTFRVKDLGRIMPRLNGRKRLIVGNHDDPKNVELTKWFEKVTLWRLFKDEGFLCTHLPSRKDQFRYKVTHNLHGHIHQNVITEPEYINNCMEHIDYTPKTMDDIVAHIRANPV
jgi:calcineurin-like phosphoesterase family protein